MITETIRKVRQKHGLSTERLGAMLGVSGRTVWNWETGRTTPNAHHMMVLDKLGYLGGPAVACPEFFLEFVGNGGRERAPRKPYVEGFDPSVTCTTFVAAIGHDPSRNCS